jgi:hypothetical protein
MARSTIPSALAGKPFLLEDARRLGVSRNILRGRQFRRVFRGVYIAAEAADTVATRAAAARLLLPASAVFSHHTAAELQGLPVPTERSVHATVQSAVPRTRVTGLVTHLCRSPPQAVQARLAPPGLPVTPPGRTFLDLAGRLSLVDLVILGDAMLRRGFITEERLRDEVNKAKGGRGVVQARAAASLVRARVDSPMETQVRLLIVMAGLPCPEPGCDVLDDDGQWVATVDLQYRAQRIAIEYDGLLHLTSRQKWLRDLATRDLLRDLGWDVIVLTAADVFGSPARTLSRIRDKLAARGHPDVPNELAPGWAEHIRRRAAA